MKSTLTAVQSSSPRQAHISNARAGIFTLFGAEAVMFTIFIVAYLFYAGKSPGAATPRQMLRTPWISTACLLLSSVTIVLALRALRLGLKARFLWLWLLTAVLGGIFLCSTLLEWKRLLYQQEFTIASNLFGTTFYSLVGLHALHVTLGLVMLATVLVLAIGGKVGHRHAEHLSVVSLYWHFVDVVWAAVFSVVYLIGR